MSRRYRRQIAVAVLILLTGGMLWRGTSANQQTAAETEPANVSAKYGGRERYLTHVSTDKPIYRPGEMLYVRGVVLHHATRKPLSSVNSIDSYVEITGPKGDQIAAGTATMVDSVIGFQWPIPASATGGQYKVKISHPISGHPPADRGFEVRNYRAPRLKSQIKFLRDGYGPSDEVVATLHTERAEGGTPVGAKVTAIARVDGVEVFRGPTSIDENGNCITRFHLPPEIRRGEGVLAMVVEDGGVVETASKTLPILLQTVDLTMFPEGGDLVAGLRSRVYIEAFTPAGKPADLAGVVVDDMGNEVAGFRSQHEGRGRFEFTPVAATTYRLKVTEPSGISVQYPLPTIKDAGAVLLSDRDIYLPHDPIAFEVASSSSKALTLTLNKREQELLRVPVQVKAGVATAVAMRPPNGADGVLVATLRDKTGTPLAERLIFRKPAGGLRVKISADSDRYVPGGKAALTIETADQDGTPVSAVVGITVTDDSVLEMIETRDQAPRLPVMVLLEPEVRDLADAHVYLDGNNKDAPLAVDLLLGTQGWRRFAFIKPNDFATRHTDDAQRVLAARSSSAEFPGREGFDAFWFRRDLRTYDLFKGMPRRFRGQGLKVEEIQPAAAAPADEVQDNAVVSFAVANRPEPPPQPAPQIEARLAQVDKEDADLAILGAPFGGGRFDALGADALRADALARLRNDMVAVRVFAHQVRPGRQPAERVDFTETLFWHAGIKTSDSGVAKIELGLNDAVTSFSVFADGFNELGSLGEGTLQIESVEPFYLEPKLPIEVTSGDQITLPIGVVNATDRALGKTDVHLAAAGFNRDDINPLTVTLGPDTRRRLLAHLTAGIEPGTHQVTLRAAAGQFADRVTRTISVRPLGFPVELGYGGLLEANGSIRHEIHIPVDAVDGSLSARVVVYPTPLASLTEALERLIREPNGCFEQTSSTTYPLVMAQRYFLSHEGVDPSLVERSAEALEKGYQRLIGFESPSGGFEWFGGDPGHDALTAYGLMEFTDMARVRHVDQEMLARTQEWLLDQRDGKGGFKRLTRTLHTWVADPEIATTYNVWALLESGCDADLSVEVDWIRAAAERTRNTYVAALAANVLALAGDKDGFERLVDRLAGKQNADGSLEDATGSVVGSGGTALQVETTALAVLAWLRQPSYAENVEPAIRYLAESCKAGRFGSTQSTVLALRAIIAYDQSRARPKEPGTLQIVVDNKAIGEAVAFSAEHQGAIELPSIAHRLSKGPHSVEVKMADGSQMPYSVAVDYHRLTPDSSNDCRVHLEVELSDESIDEGAATEANVVVINRAGESIPTPIAIIGIPGGLEVRHDQLKELVEAKKIAAYEVMGREVVLYWRALDAEQRVDVPISLVASIPGSYTGPASRAYLYYTDEDKTWVEGLAIKIRPVR